MKPDGYIWVEDNGQRVVFGPESHAAHIYVYLNAAGYYCTPICLVNPKLLDCIEDLVMLNHTDFNNDDLAMAIRDKLTELEIMLEKK